MLRLTCEVSETLMHALEARCARTGEPVSHIVMSALAEALGVPHATLFQVSTAGALVEGVYDGVVTVGALKRHGDFGLGTFDGLDGEMLTLDGHVWQVRASGGVAEVPDEARVPFALVTTFRAEREAALGTVADFEGLAATLDGLRRTANLFCAARVEGRFRRVRTRATCRAAPGESLVAATAHQVEFEFAAVDGVMAGFWSPAYTGGLDVAGWHLHFLTADRAGGGHVLACEADASELHAAVQELSDLHIVLPETTAFLQADLRRDPGHDLAVAKGARGPDGPGAHR